MTLRVFKRYFNTRLTFAAMSGSSKGIDDAERKLDTWKVNVDMAKLNERQRKIHAEHLKSIKESRDWYLDPETGYQVFTIWSHLKRGNCCGNVCRHCPYQHRKVDKKMTISTTFNTAFYD